MVDKRVVQNIGRLETIEQELLALHAAAGVGGYSPLAEDTAEFYLCTLSQCSVVDLMHDDAAEVGSWSFGCFDVYACGF